MLPESLSPNYTGKKESNPYKGTDLSTLQMRSSNKVLSIIQLLNV